MSASYIPEGTNVVCTFQMDSAPKKLIAIRSKITVFYKEKPLLTIDDKNINEAFICKNPANLAATLLALGAGIIIGALLVGLGPVGWVVAGVLAAACLIGGAYAATQARHKCTAQLAAGVWFQKQPTVKFDGINAITQISMLQCGNDGILKPIISYSVACDLANKIVKNNWGEVGVNTVTSFITGLLLPAGFAGKTVFAGLKVAGWLAVGNIIGTFTIFGVTMGERSILRKDEELNDNQFYKSMNEDIDPNEYLQKVDDPSDLSDASDLYKFIDASAKDAKMQSQLNRLSGLTRQGLSRDAYAIKLFDQLQKGKLPELKKNIINFNKSKMRPNMVKSMASKNVENLKSNLKQMAKQGILFFLPPMLTTYFSEKVRKEFAIAAENDMNNSLGIQSEKPNG